jgi:hypothetical protein
MLAMVCSIYVFMHNVVHSPNSCQFIARFSKLNVVWYGLLWNQTRSSCMLSKKKKKKIFQKENCS